jgi:hypothetical protein
MPARPYLLFVRAGAQSLHGRLLAENPERNWDCCVSWYVSAREEALAEYYSGGGFNKFEGFLEFWRARAEPWPYRYVLIIDDDIYLAPGEISRCASAMQRICPSRRCAGSPIRRSTSSCAIPSACCAA